MTEDEPQDPYAGQPYQPYPVSPPAPGQPGYPPAGYAGQTGYPPAGYPQQPGQPGYGHYPAYPPYPYGPYPYQTQPGSRRPGSATTAAVLAWVAGGLLILAGLVLFSGASHANDFGNEFNGDRSPATSELAVGGFVNLVAAGLLISGGVMLSARKTAGRSLIAAGTVVVIVAAIYWVIRAYSYGGTVFFAMTYGALVVIGLSLAYTSTTREWLATSPAAPPR